MKKHVIDDMMDILHKQDDIRDERIKPVTPKTIKHRNPLNTLAKLVLMWPPKDLRLDEDYALGYDIKSYDDDIMIDLADGMHLEIKSKSIKNQTVTFNLMLPSNLDVFERFNLTVQHHNEKWREMGSPEKVFDPRHGTVSNIKDTNVDAAHISSRHNKIPDSINDDKSYGSLTKAKPDLKRVPILEIIYHLTILKNEYEIGYVVKNMKKEILYNNHHSHEDMAFIIRQSIQEIWGNPEIYGTSGSFLDGLSMLFQGKKTKICKEENDVPPHMKTTDVIKNPNSIERITTEISEKALRSSSTLMRYLTPLILGVLLLIHSGRCLMISFNPYGNKYDRDTSLEFVSGLVILGVISIVIQIISRKMHRKSSELNIKKRFS